MGNMERLKENVNRMCERIKRIDAFNREQGTEAFLVRAVSDSETADERFLAKNIMTAMQHYNSMSQIVFYLNKPVKKEGRLFFANGKAFIDEHEIPDAAQIEYMKNGEWEFGTAQIMDDKVSLRRFKGNIDIEDAKGTHVRMR